MRNFPSIFLVARDLPDSTEYFAGYRLSTCLPYWATPTNEHNPIVYEDRDTAEFAASELPAGAYVVEFAHKP